MRRQSRLPLGGQEAFEGLWESFPKQSCRQLIKLYACLMAKAARLAASQNRHKETNHDPTTDTRKQQDSH